MFRTFRKVFIALVVLLVLLGLAPNAYAEEIQPEPIVPELATGEPPVPTATPQKGGGNPLPELAFYISGDCQGWKIIEATEYNDWTAVSFFVLEGTRGGPGGMGFATTVADYAYRDSGTSQRTFTFSIYGEGDAFLWSYPITAFRDISDCQRRPAPKFQAKIVCAPQGALSTYTLELSGDISRFNSFEDESGHSAWTGLVVDNRDQMITGYYQVSNGYYDVASVQVAVSAVEPCGTPVIDSIDGPATVDPPAPVTYVGPISPIKATMSVYVACDKTFKANLYIPRGDNHDFMGLWYEGSAMSLIGGYTTVVNFDGSGWPASVSLTDSQGRTVNITITEYNDCTAAPAAAVSSVTVVAGSTSVGPTLPATGAGDKTWQIAIAASCVLTGIMFQRVRRQNV